MATLAPTTDVANYTGIKMPNLRNRFRVRFLDGTTKEELPDSAALASQLVRLSATWRDREVNSKDVFPLEALFEDDVTNVACKALQSLMINQGFDLAVEYLDGNSEVIRTMFYDGVKMRRIEFSPLEYDSPWGTDYKINLRTPKLSTLDLEDLKESNPLLYSVYELVNRTTVEFTHRESKLGQNNAAYFRVIFEYSGLKTAYAS